MCDIEPCDHRGCYGKCPTSTRCSRNYCRPQYDCSCCSCVKQCLPGKVKDFMTEFADESIIFKHYYNILRSMPYPGKDGGRQDIEFITGRNSGRRAGGAADGKFGGTTGGKTGVNSGGASNGGLTGGGASDGKTGGKGKKGRKSSESQNIFGNMDEIDGEAAGVEGTGDGPNGSGNRESNRKQNREKRLSEHDKLKNHVTRKLDSFFDDALKQGMLDPNASGGKGKGKPKKRSAKYYKNKLGIDISCFHNCIPLCCEAID